MSEEEEDYASSLKSSLLSFLPKPLKWWMRRLLWKGMALHLRRRSTPWQINPMDKILVFAPHQDDEALGCAGLILKHRKAGGTVHIAYLTDGAGSHPDHPTLTPEKLARYRREEAIKAADHLWVHEDHLHFLGAPDGSLSRFEIKEVRRLMNRVSDLVEELKPTQVLITSHVDGSSEHEEAFLVVFEAVMCLPEAYPMIEYMVWSRWKPMTLFGLMNRKILRLAFPEERQSKKETLQLYKTQVQACPPDKEPVLSPHFLSLFASGEEFFFPIPPRRRRLFARRR